MKTEAPEPSANSLAANVAAAFTSPAGGESVLSLRLPQHHHAMAFGVPVQVCVTVGKFPKALFGKVRAGAEFSTTLYTLDAGKLGADGIYAVSADIAPLIADQVRLVQLRLAVTAQSVPYLVPVPLPGPDGRWNPWHQSLAAALDLAETKWVRVVANQLRGGFDVFVATGNLPDPVWPRESFEELLEVAFKGKLITSDSHPLVQQLLGAA